MKADAFGPLVAPVDLQAKLGEPSLLIIDLRLGVNGGREGYEAGHVPGAVFTDYGADGWRIQVGDAPGLLPSSDHLARLFGGLGITPERRVVLVPYGASANDLATATRAYWTLKVAGHGPVSILDGGWLGWKDGGARPVETGPRIPQTAPDYPVVWRNELRATAAECLLAVGLGSRAFIDARSTTYFEGREKAAEAARPGRIPGAVSRDHSALFDPSRHGLRPFAELEALFSGAPGGPAISYCNTGHTASLNWFVLSELLGRDVALYDGSMTDWTQDPDRPVATG